MNLPIRGLSTSFILIVILSWLVAACSSVSPVPTLVPVPTSTQTDTPFTVLTTPFSLAPTAVPPTQAPTLTPTQQPAVWIAPYLPLKFRHAISLPEGLLGVEEANSANLSLEVGGENPVSRWVYVLVVPFPSLVDQVAFEEVLRFWQGENEALFAGHPLLIDASTYKVFQAWWGEPGQGAVQVMPSNQILDYAWDNRPAWALIPFELVKPQWKVLSVDNQSPIWWEFDLLAYPLTVPFSLKGEAAQGQIAAKFVSALPASNRAADKLTTLVMTGVTALVRGTSNTMYAHGITYPAMYIRDILRDADITHISNEVPFAESCPSYVSGQTNLRFCTYPANIGLLEDIGTDIVEITGDHFGDWGPEATLYTLQLYRERGWFYYGGGANSEEGKQPVVIDHNGNRLAFIGCNAKGGGYATAKPDYPGAVRCDYSWMHAKIRELKKAGYLPIVTFQHQEIYSYTVDPKIRLDFTGMADAGAVIVSGSQAHQPQNMEFYKTSFIHYGLGNLFFDQVGFSEVTQDAFIDRHVFYDGRYINTELFPIHFIDMARARPMTPEEREVFYNLIFKASGW